MASLLGGQTIAGGKMKSDGLIYWHSPNTLASNQSGFSGLAAGMRIYGATPGLFSNKGIYGSWWSTLESNTFITHAYGRWLRYDEVGTGLIYENKNGGMSVRCVKD
jgi:uncharacterized protein (TIGR02145 family)